MKLNLPDTVATPQDLASLISEVHSYSKWASHEMIKQKVKASGNSPQPTLSPATSQLIRDWSGNKSVTQAMLDDLISSLEAYKKTAPTMTITLAAVAPNDLKATLVKWARANIAPNMMISFQINRSILGGMVVKHGSRIFDWSFRRKLLNNEQSFLEVLSRV